MAKEFDRQTRAGHYVLGLMSETDRERAQRDLETDAAFRDAVVAMAEQLRARERMAAPAKAGDRWSEIGRLIGDLPQMKTVPLATDALPAPQSAPRGRWARLAGRRMWLVAAAMLASGIAGYLVGVYRSAPPPSTLSIGTEIEGSAAGHAIVFGATPGDGSSGAPAFTITPEPRPAQLRAATDQAGG